MSEKVVDKLADRYNELIVLRREALAHYGARSEFSMFGGPPVKFALPKLVLGQDANARVRIGPLSFLDRPPLWNVVEDAIEQKKRPVCILEIGPAAGILAGHLREKFGNRIGAYYALERDRTYSGPYQRLDRIDLIDRPIDIIIAAEVAEHMSADDWYEHILAEASKFCAPDATLVMSVPNPVSPGGISRDLTHVQNYPWYDLYALMRLKFSHVEIFRAYYSWSPQRLAFVLPRIALCSLIELDWCDQLICVASDPGQQVMP
jgi:hypothetical protein